MQATVGGRAIEQWDSLWVRVEGGLTRYHPELRYKVGLYRVSLGRHVMALGTGTDKSGGLAKRLSDFRRGSSSGRNHHAGQMIYENLEGLTVEVLTTGHGALAQEVARELRLPMVRLHRPAWNAPNAPFMRKGRR